MVSSGLPDSCLLWRMCDAYVEVGLFVVIYLICSRYLLSIYLPVWPTCNLLHIFYCNLYIPLQFTLFTLFTVSAQQLHVHQHSTLAKPGDSSAVLGSGWQTVCLPKHVEHHINMKKSWYTVKYLGFFLYELLLQKFMCRSLRMKN
jgi:hypothetical protein